MAEVSRWQAWRPLWIWTRGWLFLSTIAVLSGGTAFRRFPVPAIEQDGNPLEVLLFDQNGRPLRSLPTWVYEEAEQNPGFREPFEYGEGAVEFTRDEFGRIIPNLYPLYLFQHGAYGLEAMPPPALGFPQLDDVVSDQNDEVVPTTITSGVFDYPSFQTPKLPYMGATALGTG